MYTFFTILFRLFGLLAVRSHVTYVGKTKNVITVSCVSAVEKQLNPIHSTQTRVLVASTNKPNAVKP